MTDQPHSVSAAAIPPVPAVDAAIDVAIWFLDRARADDVHLPLQKLHRLLYLAQGLYGALAKDTGGLLMPAVFVAEEAGPIEPNLYRLFVDGRPGAVPAEAPPARVVRILEEAWQRFGHMPVERLNSIVARNTAYVVALESGRGAVISQAAIAESFVASLARPVEESRILRSQTGAPVTVKAWRPAALKGTPTRAE